MPCLDEADTIGACVRKAQQALRDAGASGEVVVADNGSVDGSAAIAAGLGARVVRVEARGYGSALIGGIESARGRYVIMGDADESYDFGEVPKFLAKLRAGHSFVMGCRLPSGGGTVMPGAMPPLHRWFGNPMFSLLARLWFRTPVHDINCGMRGFTADAYERLGLRCTGMEFATEMIIKASCCASALPRCRSRCTPTAPRAPTPLTHVSRRLAHAPAIFLFTPRWLFLVPGLLLTAAGRARIRDCAPGLTIGRRGFDVHTLLFASLSMLAGQRRFSSPSSRRRSPLARASCRSTRARLVSSNWRPSSAGCWWEAPPRSSAWRCWRAPPSSGGGWTSVRSTTHARCAWRFPGPR